MADEIKTCGHESPTVFTIQERAGKYVVRPAVCGLAKDHKATVPHEFTTRWNR